MFSGKRMIRRMIGHTGNTYGLRNAGSAFRNDKLEMDVRYVGYSVNISGNIYTIFRGCRRLPRAFVDSTRL